MPNCNNPQPYFAPRTDMFTLLAPAAIHRLCTLSGIIFVDLKFLDTLRRVLFNMRDGSC